jgi:arabinose-5-phosphate isomerase
MKNDSLNTALNVISTEIEALQKMSERLDISFLRAVNAILQTTGRVVVIGMGKSGLIGSKIVATFASTGTPSFFVHPGDAFHGDLGMIKPIDVALLISYSGETEEVIRLLPFLNYQNNTVIAMTGSLTSTLARNSEIVLDITVDREACRNNLAPTSSTTATLVMGDALAVALTEARGFQPEDFARFHPGGTLGKKLLTRVSDVMSRSNLPVCTPKTIMKQIVDIITRGRLGLVLVIEANQLVGLITDGDIRRAFDHYEPILETSAEDIMTPEPKTVPQDMMLVDAELMMKHHKINSLVVVDNARFPVGVLQIYDFC